MSASPTDESNLDLLEEAFITESGETITDEVAERLADEAEAGYDIDPSQIVDRRSLPGSNGRCDDADE